MILSLERGLTAGYIIGARRKRKSDLQTGPSEARVFAEDDTIKKWKLWQEYVGVMPEIRTRYTDEQVRELEERYKGIRIKRKEESARNADSGLAEICGSCYLEPTFHSHATAYGIGTRLRET